MSKGARTREAIVQEAIKAASVEGFEGLSIGHLAGRMKMSKSGLFAHFGSKEELQKAVVDETTKLFMANVWSPAMRAPRGIARLEQIFERWVSWTYANPHMPGGCLLTALATEMDDKPGPVRDQLVEMQHEFMAMLARAAALGVQAGELRDDLDCRQFAFEMNGIVLSMHFHQRLLRDEEARARARAAFADLLARSRATH